MQNKEYGNKRIRKIFRLTLRVVLFLVLFIVLLCLSILLPPVQNFVKGQAVNYLEGKIGTRVAIDKIYIGLPKTVNIDGVYLEDRTGDTLLYAGNIHVDIGLFGLITGREIDIASVALNDVTANIYRQLPDTAFNFQYIIDAFSSGTPEAVEKDTSSMSLRLGDIRLHNIKAAYKDVVTGYDASLQLGNFETRINEFDLENLKFGIEEIQLRQVKVVLYQTDPLMGAPAAEEMASDTVAGSLPVLQLGPVALEDIHLEYRSDPGAIYSLVDLGRLNLTTRALDLQGKRISLETISLDNTSAMLQLRKAGKAERPLVKENPPEEQNAHEEGWSLKIASLQLNNNNLQFDDENAPVQKRGMDYMHLRAEDLTLHVNDFIYNNDSIAGSIRKGSLKEKSGFELKALQTDFLYASNQAYLKDLLLVTPGTEIKKAIAIRYPSIDTLQKDINLLEFELDLDDSRLQLKDLLTFVPDLDLPLAGANDVLLVSSRLRGRVDDLRISVMQLSGLGNTVVDISGSVKGIRDINTMNADLRVNRLSSSRSDLLQLLPRGTLPDNITLPQHFSLTGNLRGKQGKLQTALQLNTSLGNAVLNGSLQEMADPARAVYDITLETQGLDIGTILQDKKNLGPVSISLTAKGKGYDVQHADAVFSGKIAEALLKGYHYRDLDVEGSIAQQQAKINAAIADPNIHITLHAAADLANEYPAVQLTADIDSIKTKELHLTNDELIYRGNVRLDFPATHPDSLEGKLFILQSLLVHNQHRIQMDTIQLEAGQKDSLQFIELKSDVLSALLEGKYKLTEMGDIIPQLINPYFMMDTANKKPVSAFDFRLNAGVHQSPVLSVFMPDLTRLDSVKLAGRFTSQNGWHLDLTAPAIVYGATSVNGLAINAQTQDSALAFNAGVQGIRSGESVQLFKSSISGALADNKADVVLHLKDKTEKEKYHLNLLVAQEKNNTYHFSVVPDSLLLNYQAWNVPEDNSIVYSPDDIHIHNFIIEKEGQAIKMQSESTAANAPLNIEFADFRVSTITGFVQSDSIGVNGRINGNVLLRDLTKQPVFAGDLRLEDLSVKKDTVGNILIKVDNATANTYTADVSVTGNGNDIQLSGTYETTGSSFDMDLDIRTVPLVTLERLSGGALRNTSGSMNGRFSFTGTAEQPHVNGRLGFDKVGLNVSALNNYFNIDQQQLTVGEEGIRFNKFSIKDSANNELTLDGMAATTNFRNYNLDLTLRSDNFGALNSTRKDNDIFYGKLFFDSNLEIKGTETAPEIDGRLKINNKTAMTVVLPQEEPGVVDREGVVVFVDRQAGKNDSLFLIRYDSLNTTSLQGMNVSVNVEVDKEADFTVVVDEGSDDHLKVRGGAQLNVGVEPGGKIAMSGVYEIDKGSYDFSFNLLKRAFIIDKGSKITWGGEPTDATVDITAIYTANTSPLDLVKNQLGAEVTPAERNTYLQKLPFNVLLKMEGELMHPRISFDIVLPDEKVTAISSNITSNVKTKLDMMRQDEAEMNKQVFALLLLNRFVAEDPFSSSAGTSTATMVRQSVNKIMTEQLNRWAADLIKGVDINFDLESTEDYSTGERQDRTDLNVGLSKRMFNDRLTVTVGSNFELDGPQTNNSNSSNIAGNVNIQYRLTEDGRYMLRGYRNNEYQGIIEGYVVETGVGFTITMDYNRFREIFQKRLTAEERKKRRQERRKQSGDEKNPGNKQQEK